MSMLLLCLFLLALLCAGWLWRPFVEKKRRNSRLPPVVELSEEDIYQRPQYAYQAAIEKYGPVVGVVRKNQLEYIIDHTLTAQVLTNDLLFSFEHATLRMLNLSVLLSLPRSFAKELDTIVQEDITANMDNIIEALVPIFQHHMQSLKSSTSEDEPISVDLESVVHVMMAESMLTLIFGRVSYLKHLNSNHH
ncbi:hypothetical protein VKT23_010135 [Stygiomarasmius scandens]|uniref:Uncharacterized protein n=1 Tax=Marasmiellus scandens TaxID=2682957 RepID=A0ABR1JG89_9AGAR